MMINLDITVKTPFPYHSISTIQLFNQLFKINSNIEAKYKVFA